MSFKNKRAQGRSRLRILIADDYKDLRDLLASHVNEWFCADVDVAENGSVAIERLKSRRYDLVLSDVQMPGGDVFVLLEYISSGDCESPVVVISDRTNSENIRKRLLGYENVKALFSKPFEAESIMTTMESLLQDYPAA